MRITLIALALVTAMYPTSAQEPASQEVALRAANLAAKSAADITDAPIKMELDLEKPQAVQADRVGALVIPAKDLSAKVLENPTNRVIPLGQLWTLRLTPTLQDKGVPNDQLRLITIKTDQNDYQAALFYLGARTNKQGGMDLVVYAKEKKALLRLPMQKAEAKQDFPIEISAQKTDEKTGTLTLRFLGQYKVQLPITKQIE